MYKTSLKNEHTSFCPLDSGFYKLWLVLVVSTWVSMFSFIQLLKYACIKKILFNVKSSCFSLINLYFELNPELNVSIDNRQTIVELVFCNLLRLKPSKHVAITTLWLIKKGLWQVLLTMRFIKLFYLVDLKTEHLYRLGSLKNIIKKYVLIVKGKKCAHTCNIHCSQ